MSGPSARGGFAFQDLVLAERLLQQMMDQRVAAIAGTSHPALQFFVEASPSPGRAPEWDLMLRNGTDLILEEAKSGQIKPDDRQALWLRIRRTLEAYPAATVLPAVRLVVNADNPPTRREYWRSLATQSQHATGDWTARNSKERRRRVSKAEDLANEAIHFLTSAAADPKSKPVELSAARRLLARFALVDGYGRDAVESAVRAHLSSLSKDIGVSELLSALRGEISRRAESKDPAAHRLTSKDLVTSLSVLDRLARIDPADLRRWQALRNCSVANRNVSTSAAPSGLPYQEWRNIQPRAANALHNNEALPLSILGRGGMGKSVLLRGWLTERENSGAECLFLAATDLAGFSSDEFSAALELGLFKVRQHQNELCIGVDAIENVVDGRARVALLAALRTAAASGVSVCVTSRLLEWRSSRGTSEETHGWRSLELEEWPEEIVQEHVGASDRPNVGPALRKLLRTPLLLDLFLRTFGKAGQVPPGLQTRYGLVAAYWDRRIWPREDERSGPRRKLILDVAANEAANVHAHTLTGKEAKELTSEGLFVLNNGGQRSFRHALLRDYAMGEWLRESTPSPGHASDKLSSIVSPLLQFGTLRAALERPQDDGHAGMPALLRELPVPLLCHAGTILGEFDDVSEIDVVRVMQGLPDANQEPFWDALSAAIKLARTGCWLELFSRLPAGEGWAESMPWFTGRAFLKFQSVVECFGTQLAPGSVVGAALASRMRAWSTAPRLRKQLAEGAGWHLGHLGKLLVHLDPSVATAEWLLGITTTGGDARYWVLSELSKLAQALPPISNERLLRGLYVAAGSFREEQGILRDDPSVLPTPMGTHDRTRCLTGDGKGLLATHRATFVQVAAEVIAGYEQDLAEEDEKRAAQWAEIPAADLEPFNQLFQELLGDTNRREAVQAAHARAVQAAATFSEEATSNRAFASSASDAYWDLRDSEYYELATHLRDLLLESHSKGDDALIEHYWPGIRASVSGRLHACLLDVLTRSAPTPNETVLDELLQDVRVYSLNYAQPYLQRAIRQRWASLPQAVRQAIISNIRSAARPPDGNVWIPGPLYHAVPEGARPPDANVFIDLIKVAGHALDLPEPQAEPFAIAIPHPVQAPTRRPIDGLPDALQVPWAQIAAIPAHQVASYSDDQWAELVPVVRKLIVDCLPSPENLLDHTDLLERLTEFADAQRLRQGDDQIVETEHLRALANWSLSALNLFSTVELVSECEPLTGSFNALPPKAELWLSMARLADRVLWHPDLVEDANLNNRLFDAVAMFRNAPPDRIAYYLVTRITGWFRSNATGRPILHALVLKEIRDLHVLNRCFHWLWSFTPAEQEAILANWFARDVTRQTSHARSFARSAGEHVGCAALVRRDDGEPTGAKAFLSAVLAEQPLRGALADAALHGLFVSQAVFGAKQALVNGAIPLERATEYISVVRSCWNALHPTMSEEPNHDQAAVALWALSPILDTDPTSLHALKTNDRAIWWQAAFPLAMTIMSEGPWHEISHLVQALSESDLLDTLRISELKPILVAFDERVKALSSSVQRYRWDHAVSCAASLIQSIASRAVPGARDWLFELVSRWAAAPISNGQAVEAARNLREAL